MDYKLLSFAELQNMHMADLIDRKQTVLNAVDEQRKERDRIIGQIMFYQQMYTDNKP